MDNEEKYLPHFNIISIAGQAKSDAMEAIEEARCGNFSEARRLLEGAKETLVESHAMMFQMLQDETNGKPVDINIVAVHAQDHFTMATLTIELGEQIINLYERTANL